VGAGQVRAAIAPAHGRRRRTDNQAPTGWGYYWPDTAALAIYYDDLGQSVPPPGLIRLGAIDTGLDEFAEAGGQHTARLERAVTNR
jgi:hypothetical protein